MNKKTFLSQFPTFRKLWGEYLENIKPIPHGWTVMSDYCLDNAEKNDCIAFTICPIFAQPEQMGHFLDKQLPSDIKHIKKFPETTIKFIRDCKIFFSIVFLFPTKQKLADIQDLKTDIAALAESTMITDESRKRLKLFSQSLKKKCLNEKVLKNLSLISFLFGRIVEFLTIKHFNEWINWFPDRDDVMSIGNGIIQDMSNIHLNNAIAGRANCPKIHIGGENPDLKEFIFDPFVRYPDILTGVFSSVSFWKAIKPKEKHVQLWKEGIAGNKRIAVFVMYPDKICCLSLTKQHDS